MLFRKREGAESWDELATMAARGTALTYSSLKYGPPVTSPSSGQPDLHDAKPTSDVGLEVRNPSGKCSSNFSYDPRFYFPHFQPVVDIPTGRIVGYESLTRTHERSGSIVSAGHLFEDETVSDHIRLDIDRAVRKKALRRFANDPNGGQIFLNISPRWAGLVADDEETPTIKMIREVGIDPSRVVIEITEKLGDVASLESLVSSYRREGLKIAIDDFGVGGSQVDRLIALKPDYLKIDMGIFKDAARNGESAKVLLALSALSEQAHFEIICEGVESEEEFHFAIECGAQKVQGWLFGKADGPLLKPDITRDSVAFLQTLYLERKKAMVVRASERNNLIAKYIGLIFEYHKQESIKTVDSSLFYDAGLLRYYLCDTRGKQISPNYNFTEDGVDCDDSYLGSYWSHRPYFPIAIGLKDKIRRKQIVSRSYVDGPTKRLCKTTAMLIDDDTIMLVDALAFDDVLYCEHE